MAIDEELHKGEKIIEKFSPHPLAYLGHYIFGVFLGIISLIAFGLLGILYIILIEFIRRGHKYYITNNRIIHEFTFIVRKISSIPYSKIQDLHLTQGILERMFGVGTIHINTAGTHLIEVRFKGVKNPRKIKRIISELMLDK